MATEIDSLGAWTPTEEEGGIDDKELWNLDITLTEFILPRLKAFKEMDRKGYPVLDGIDPQDEKKSTETWEKILDDMIKGFEAHLRLAKDSPYDEDDKDDDVDYVSEKEEQKEEQHRAVIKKGFELFGRYYMSLWD